MLRANSRIPTSLKMLPIALPEVEKIHDEMPVFLSFLLKTSEPAIDMEIVGVGGAAPSR